MVGVDEPIADNIKSVHLCLDRFDGGANILCSPDFEWGYVNAERARNDFKLAHFQKALGIAHICNDC